MQNRWACRSQKLICASNDNKVLFDFFRTGVYDRNREFILTSSPSMDILISSNLERLIYTIAGQDAQKDAELMTQLKEKGVYEITAEMKEGLKRLCRRICDRRRSEKRRSMTHIRRQDM